MSILTIHLPNMTLPPTVSLPVMFCSIEIIYFLLLYSGFVYCLIFIQYKCVDIGNYASNEILNCHKVSYVTLKTALLSYDDCSICIFCTKPILPICPPNKTIPPAVSLLATSCPSDTTYFVFY